MTGLRLKNVKTGEERMPECAGVFVAIGHVPDTKLFQGQIDRDAAAGYVIPAKGTQTSARGVFAAGDCSDGVSRQAVTSAGLGGRLGD